MFKKILVLPLFISTFSMASTVNGTNENDMFSFEPNKYETTVSEDINSRLIYEKFSDANPFSLTTHKMNYILPYTYAENINRGVYSNFDDFGISEGFRHEEAKFQLSLKFPLMKSLFTENDKIYFGFTMKSYWQIYATESSRPFRNTDYNPELFYQTSFSKFKNHDTYMMLGIEHESNGQVQYLSRSWNRVYAAFGTDSDNYAIMLKTWLRISEDSKEDPFDPKGDDNPDIQDYYGNSELNLIWKHKGFHYSAMGRHNFGTGKGFLELGVTFPLYDKVKGYVQFTNGYGESLLDYNFYQRRIGVGIVFSDIL